MVAGIDSYIIKDAGMAKAGKKMVARTVEAIIRAYYMDAGDDRINAARDVMTNLGLSLTVTSSDPSTP
jgi:dsRNA-specific ribonuclease